MVIIQFRYLYLLSIRQNKVITSLRRRYLTSFWSCHIVAVKSSDEVAKTMSLQRLIMTSLHEMLQRRRFCNVVQRFHRNYMAASEQRWIVTSQQHCNDVFVSICTTLGNVEMILRIWPFEKKNYKPRFKSNIIFWASKNMLDSKSSSFSPHFKRKL